MLRGIHGYTWHSNWFMGSGLNKRKDGQTDRHCVDFNIDFRLFKPAKYVHEYVSVLEYI